MNTMRTEVWEAEHVIETAAPAGVIWDLFRNVSAWPRWQHEIDKVALHGPFAAGSRVSIAAPGQPSLQSRLVEVRENAGYLAELSFGGVRVFTDHRIEPAANGRTRVVFSVEAFGPACDEIGPAVTACLPATLRSLAETAERSS
ncbi:MAG TPA: SRPBCC family protein [Opitutaceae bacterium]|nr:SRPBCC family protein [Opitutaceae bacterium]